MANRPFLLKPSGKDYLWGGTRLRDEFGKSMDVHPLAETWECSTHPDGPSFVASGAYEGEMLSEVLRKHPDYMGLHGRNNPAGELPILIKLIDAKQDLSIQVHPTDAYAFTHEHGQLGKTEMWYVLDAFRHTRIVYGLYRDIDADTIRTSIEQGTLMKYVRQVPVKKDDVFFIEAGMIHAIGAGALIAEIQENSNLTYRLYDYDRTDRNGQRRELHVEKALAVASLKSAAEPRQPMRLLKYRQGVAGELLCRCKYFEVYRMLVNTERRQSVSYRAGEESFRVLLCTGGCGTLSFEDRMINFYKGDCVFVPADSVEMRIHGKAEFLDVRG